MRLNYLEGVRGYMALWVLVFHGLRFTPYTDAVKIPFFNIFMNGNLPVLMFIILSGFVTRILLEKEEPYQVYILRRALRLFPVYLICLTCSICLIGFYRGVLTSLPWRQEAITGEIGIIDTSLTNHYPLNVIMHYLLLHGSIPKNIVSAAYSFMGQAWSLTLEWQYYLFIPVLYRFMKGQRNMLNSVILFLFAAAVIWSHKFLMQNDFLPWMIQYFLIGFISCPLYKAYVSGKNRLLFIVLSAVALYYYFRSDEYMYLIIILWGIILYFQAHKNFISNFIFDNAIIRTAGKISYSVYCIHMIIYQLTCYLLINILHVRDSLRFTFLLLIITLVATAGISFFSYRYIENVFITLGKKRFGVKS